MKKFVIASLLVITLCAASAQADSVWYIVSGRVSALVNISPLNQAKSFWDLASAQWKTRVSMEQRLDAAIIELKACNPARFDRVFAKYGLALNTTGSTVDSAVIVPCSFNGRR